MDDVAINVKEIMIAGPGTGATNYGIVRFFSGDGAHYIDLSSRSDSQGVVSVTYDGSGMMALLSTGVTIGSGLVGDASAMLYCDSTTQGVRLPVMTEAQRDAIAAPTEGLVVYNSTTHKINVRVAAAWEAVTSA